jgi:hypothetical protein
MLQHNLLACHAKDNSIEILVLPNLNVKTTIKSPELRYFTSLCVTSNHYIFGFLDGIAKYSKSFKLINTYKSYKFVKCIAAYHNDMNIMIIGE